MPRPWLGIAIKSREYKSKCLCLQRMIDTRRWEGLIVREYSINESCHALLHILSEPHRDRALLVASVNQRSNAAILKFMITFQKLFELLQFYSKPTINFAVLVYYKAVDLTKPCPNCDDQQFQS